MDSNSVVIKFLEKKGYKPKTEYYKNINNWREWYENHVDKFHTYQDQEGQKRTIFKLGMAKRLCEDWSSILFTERDEMVCEKAKNQEYLNEQLKKLKFSDVVPHNIENAFWSGTVGTITRIVNATVKNKKIVANEKTRYKLINVDARQIIPLKIEDGNIIDVAFVSDTEKELKKIFYIEIHTLKDNGYIINNYYIDEDGNEVEMKGIVKEYGTDSDVPLFNLLSPEIVSNINNNNGLGISIYANAIDQIKGCDITYNNFMADFNLGGKKVFYNKKLVKYATQTFTDKKTGEVVTKEVEIFPDDLTRQQFQVLGDEMESVNEKPFIHEYNPDLRVDDNEKGINFALNLLSFKAGMGKGYYKFENGTIVTATQYLGENKDLVGNAKKHRNALNEYTVGIARSILLLGRTLFGNTELDENDVINLTDKDGFLVSDEELREQYRQDYNMGLMSKVTYLMKVRKISEEQARREIEQAQKDNPSIKDLLGSKTEE